MLFNQVIEMFWGLGIGDWGLVIGPNTQTPMPNSPYPIPQPQPPHSKTLKLLLKKK